MDNASRPPRRNFKWLLLNQDNRDFAARESEIRNGLATAKTFELAQQKLGEHLGFSAGKEESDASPDPWWMIGEKVIVFEDHAGAVTRGSAFVQFGI